MPLDLAVPRRSSTFRSALAIAVSALLAAGCASRAGRNDPGAAPETRVRPPQLLSSARPEWRFPTPPREGRVLDMRLKVQIDPAGRPVLNTLDLSGLGATENRDAAVVWLETARFRPA